MSTGRGKKKAKTRVKKSVRKRATKKATRRVAGRPSKRSGTKSKVRKKATKKTAKRSRKTGKKTRKVSAGSSALRRLQPELERALSRLLARVQQKLSRLPHTSQLRLLELETGGYTYTLSRLRPQATDSLTRRQKQIARLVGQGITNKEIGARLGISPATVAAHLRTIFTKMRVKTRTALAKHALAYYG